MASSGLIVRLGSFPPKKSWIIWMTLGMRVDPPTSTTSWIWFLDIYESRSTFSTGGMHSLKNGMHNSSNLALVMVMLKSSLSARLSTSMVVYVLLDRIRLALSHWVRSLLRARWLLRMSMFFFFWKSAAQYSTSLESKSSPPRWVSPAVAFTSKIPSSIFSRDTSKVPPPKSKINTFFSPYPFLSMPYAMAAAVGSLMILSTFSPAMQPASFVACRYESLK